VRGARELIRRGLDDPLLMHYVPDSGHVEVYEDLGLLPPGRAMTYMPSADRHFLKAGERRLCAPESGRIGFAGNVYVTLGETLPLLRDPFMQRVDEVIRFEKNANWDVPAWELLMSILSQTPAKFREAEGLTPDFPLFWWLALDLLSKRVSTSFRLHVLESIDLPVDFYGNFIDPESSKRLGAQNVKFCGTVPYAQLHELFRRYELWVDVTNTPFIYGCGAKVFNCFAAGSFMLIDYRRDVRDIVGEVAESFMYRSREELRDKARYYLEHPVEREAVTEAVQSIVRERLTWTRYYKRVCEDFIRTFEPAC
jgi:hypothetical protein